MAFGITGDTDGKIVTVLGTDVADEVDGLGEFLVAVSTSASTAILVCVSILLSRRIASESEDIADADFFGRFQSLVNSGAFHVGTGEMEDGGNAELALTDFGQLERFCSGGTSSAPGDGDKERAQSGGHASQARLEVGKARGSLGGKELKGEVVGGRGERGEEGGESVVGHDGMALAVVWLEGRTMEGGRGHWRE